MKEGHEIVALSFRQHGAIQARALPGSVEVVNAQACPHDMQRQRDTALHGTGKLHERVRQTARVPGTQNLGYGGGGIERQIHAWIASRGREWSEPTAP